MMSSGEKIRTSSAEKSSATGQSSGKGQQGSTEETGAGKCGERGQKGQRKIEKTVQIGKMRRNQQRKGETSKKAQLASHEPNMRLLVFRMQRKRAVQLVDSLRLAAERASEASLS